MSLTEAVQEALDDLEGEDIREERLQSFGDSMGKLRDTWIRARRASGWDRECKEDLDQYNGIDSAQKSTATMMESVRQGGYPVQQNQAAPARSAVFINITRPKTDTAEARLCDILIPTDERNWGIQPTPVPEMAGMIEDDSPHVDPATGQQMMAPDGTPIKQKEIALQIEKIASQKAEGMQREIDDQLVECDYKGEQRKAIHDASVMGTGVLKGPIVENRTEKSWRRVEGRDGSVYVLEIVQETKPASYRVDPRRVWEDPTCGESIHNGRGIFELQILTAKQVRELAKQPGYLKDQIRAVLEEGPQTAPPFTDEFVEESFDPSMKSFQVWEYWGEVDREDLLAAGVEVPEDELKSIDACVVMINNRVVKAFLHPLDTGDLPYDFFPWARKPDSARGRGVPRLMNSQQRVINAAWRAMMDNAGLSRGPNAAINAKKLQPADKQWNIQGNKIWIGQDDDLDVSKAIQFFTIPTNQAEMEQIIALATKLIDEETSVPLLAQGDARNVPDTVGGMQMLMNNTNVVLRRLVKQFDDMITRPHIRRYYDWNMMYSEKDDIKGDFNIDARGSSALLVRDIQNQAFTNLLALGSNPVYAPMIDPKKLFEKALQAQHVQPQDIMLSEEEIERRKQEMQANPPPMAPQVQAAQIRAQAEMQRAESQSQADQVEMQTRMQLAQQDAAMKREELLLQRDIEMLRLAATKELTLEQIKAKLADSAMRIRSDKELFNAEANLKLQTGQGI